MIDRLVAVDQRPIGRTPRSTLATYTGLFDAVRREFAATPAARRRGWTAGRFSFNVAEGRCETCQGEGFVSVELLFLPGTYATCPACDGARYNEATLRVRYRDRTIADVLAMTVDEASEFLADIAGAARSLTTLHEVGLGYLRLGQPATELSGGEAQRIKLASELQRPRRGHTLYVLDEPTTGLHPADVDLLDAQLHRLVDAGNTVVVAEHDMRMVAGCGLGDRSRSWRGQRRRSGGRGGNTARGESGRGQPHRAVPGREADQSMKKLSFVMNHSRRSSSVMSPSSAEALEVVLAGRAGSEQHQHRRRRVGLVAEAVDAAGRNVEEVVGAAVDPVVAVVQLDRAGQHEERLGHRAVEVRAGPAAVRGDVDAVQAVVAAGRLLVGQVVVLDQAERVVVRRVGAAPQPGTDLGLVFGVSRRWVGRHDE